MFATPLYCLCMSVVYKDMATAARRVLALNDQGDFTVPARGLYPHQWLWDSCFTAIGLRHIDPKRAATELKRLAAAQWKNGMIPNMVLHSDIVHSIRRWRSDLSPHANESFATSGITQPPMLAEAVWLVGESLKLSDCIELYEYFLPVLLDYHRWLYRERDPHGEGIVALLHPWESGMDNSPPLMQVLKNDSVPAWIKVTETLGISKTIEHLRRDHRWALEGQRSSTIDALHSYSLQRSLRRIQYDSAKGFKLKKFVVNDLAFNSMLVRANSRLVDIAQAVKRPIPSDLKSEMSKTKHALELLWHHEDGQYYSRNALTHELIREPSIATLLPLYAGSITKRRAKQLVDLLKNDNQFGQMYPAPSVPLYSESFRQMRYWQGPTWINMNWMIIDGLERYEYRKEANELRRNSLDMITQSGMREYFDPLSGKGLGAESFSWTAALILDLLQQQP